MAAVASNFVYGSAPSPRDPCRPLLIGPPVAGWQVMECAQAMSVSCARSIAIENALRPSRPGSLGLVVSSPGLAPGLDANGPRTKLNPRAVLRAPGKTVSSLPLIGSFL